MATGIQSTGQVEDLYHSNLARKRKTPIPAYDSRWFFPHTSPDDDVPGNYKAIGSFKVEGDYDQSVHLGDSFDPIAILFPPDQDYHLIRRNERNEQEKVYADVLQCKRYIIILTFYIPVMKHDAVASACYDIEAIFNDLAQEHDDFQVVLVARMRPDFPDRHATEVAQDAFDCFFNAFSRSFLAVPITDDNRCHELFEKCGSAWYWLPGCIIADSQEKQVLETEIDILQKLGADLYPFSGNTRVEEVFKQMNDMLCGKMTLAGFLQCHIGDTDSDILTCARSDCPCGIKASLSSITNKVVFLYYLYDGDFMDQLRDLYKHCMPKKDEFELIVVRSNMVAKPSTSLAFDSLLANTDCCGWLQLSFKDRVSRRVSRLFDYEYEDKLVVVGPNTSYVDVDGRLVVNEYGIEHYPFTKQTVWDDEVQRIRGLRLQEWLRGCGIHKLVNADGKNIHVTDLEGTNVFVYFCSISSTGKFWDWEGRLSKWLDEMEASSERKLSLIFVPLQKVEGDGVLDLGTIKRWAFFPESDFTDVNKKTLMEKLFGKNYLWNSCLCAFGPNGRLLRLGDVLESSLDGATKPATFPETDEGLRTDVGLLVNSQSYRGLDGDIVWCDVGL